MEIQWEEFFNTIKDESLKKIIKELQDVSIDALTEGSEYAYSQCKLIYKYMKQKKEGKITKEEFDSLLVDLSDIMKLESLKANLATRQLVLNLIDVCLKIVQNGLGVLIVF